MISSRLSAQAQRVCEVMMARERDPFYSCPTGSAGHDINKGDAS
jgi:hypothetical protein